MSGVDNLFPFEADMSCYETTSVILGKGNQGFSTVVLATHKPSGDRVAVHRISLEDCPQDLNYIAEFINRARQLKHENLLWYLATFIHKNDLILVSPFMSYGSAQDILRTRFPLGLPKMAVSFIVKDVLEAVKYLHCRRVVHRSIRASHVLISGAGQVLLSGLRYSCSLVNDWRCDKPIHDFPEDDCKGNWNWLAPEILAQDLAGYHTSSDIYSIGILSLELGTGLAPFNNMAPTELMLVKLHNLIPKPNITESVAEVQEKLHESPKLLALFDEFYSSCLMEIPVQRATIEELVGHGFVRACRSSERLLVEILDGAIASGDSVQNLSVDNVANGGEHHDDLVVSAGDYEWEF